MAAPTKAAAQQHGTGAVKQQEAQQQPQPAPKQPQPPDEDKWVVNKPVERRSELLTEELNDCFGRFWTWVACGGPAARMRQLYINGRLSR